MYIDKETTQNTTMVPQGHKVTWYITCNEAVKAAGTQRQHHVALAVGSTQHEYLAMQMVPIYIQNSLRQQL